MTKRLLSLLLAVLMVCSLCACGKQAETPEASPSPEPEQVIWPTTYCLGAKPTSLDPAQYISSGDATYLVNLYSGLVGYRLNGAGATELTADLCESLPGAQTDDKGLPYYEFRLREGLKWSDGTDLTAEDFIYSWNRVLSMPDVDERYLLDCIDGYDRGRLNLTASEDGRTLKVTLAFPEPNFLKILANPVFFPVQKAAVDTGADWSLKAETLVTSGAFKVTHLSDTEMLLAKNEQYWDAGNVTAEVLRFDFTDEPNEALDGFLLGRYALADSLPSEQLLMLREEHADAYHTAPKLGVYSLCFNLNDPALAEFTEAERVQIRTALGLLIDRSYICDAIAKAGQLPAAAYVPDGITDVDGSDFAAHNGPKADGSGYYSTDVADYEDNCKQAIKLLKAAAKSSGKFSISDSGRCKNFPALSYLTSDSTGHVDIANYLRELYFDYGITLNISTVDMTTFLAEREKGDYSIIRHSWTADYDDPLLFLMLWSTSSNSIGLGWGAHAQYDGYTANIGGEERSGLTWMESYDGLLYSIQTTADPRERSRMIHELETLLMSTGAVCPLYFYTDVFLCSDELDGMYLGPDGAKYFRGVTTHEGNAAFLELQTEASPNP